VDLASTIDRTCLDCGKTWVTCDLPDRDLVSLERAVRTVDERTIYSVLPAPACTPERGKYLVQTATRCGTGGPRGATMVIERIKNRWSVLSKEERSP
jgi:hypothetical protein